MFLNLFFHVLKGVFIVDFSRQQIEKGKRICFKSEYSGLKLYFPQTKVILESMLFSGFNSFSDLKVQQKEELKTWGRSNLVIVSGFQWHNEFCAFGLGIPRGRKLFLSYIECFTVVLILPYKVSQC